MQQLGRLRGQRCLFPHSRPGRRPGETLLALCRRWPLGVYNQLSPHMH